MKIMLSDGTEVNCDTASEDARVMVLAALEKNKKQHEEKVNTLVEAVFLSTVESAIKECVRDYAASEVRRFFETKTGKNAIKEATKAIATRTIDEMVNSMK